MAENSKIEWTTHTASPWHGCSKIAAGCENCYAAALSVRNPGTLGIWGDEGTRVKSKSFVKNLRAWNKSAAARGVVESVFPSICDPFEDRPELEPWRREMFSVIDECDNLRLLLLTKRPENIRRMWPDVVPIGNLDPRASAPGHPMRRFRQNVCLGTSIAEQPDADANIPSLLACRDLCPVLFLSCEPLIGPVDLSEYQYWRCPTCGRDGTHDWSLCPQHGAMEFGHGIDWVIVGGESGPHSRPCDVAWVRSLSDQCKAAGVPCFVKQLGSRPLAHTFDPFTGESVGTHPWSNLSDSKGGDWSEWPDDLRVREFPVEWSPAERKDGEG